MPSISNGYSSTTHYSSQCSPTPAISLNTHTHTYFPHISHQSRALISVTQLDGLGCGRECAVHEAVQGHENNLLDTKII